MVLGREVKDSTARASASRQLTFLKTSVVYEHMYMYSIYVLYTCSHAHTCMRLT